MTPFNIPFALLGLIAFALVIPPWIWLVSNRTSGMPPEVQGLVTLSLPIVGLLYVASWMQPRSGGEL